MKRRRALDHRRGLVLGIAGGVAAALSATPALALPSCSVAALNALGVPNLTVTSATVSVATNVCVATGTVATSGFGAPDGLAGFQVQLPQSGWNSKFLFLGVGGFAGGLGASTNAGDPGAAAAQRFATAVTDTGHQAGSTDGVGPCSPRGCPMKRRSPIIISAPPTR
jgi:tannase/feruloyl esterase